jgi:hypothetical protein
LDRVDHALAATATNQETRHTTNADLLLEETVNIERERIDREREGEGKKEKKERER